MKPFVGDRVCLRVENLEDRSHPSSLFADFTAGSLLLSSYLSAGLDSSTPENTGAAIVGSTVPSTSVSGTVVDLSSSTDSGGSLTAGKRISAQSGSVGDAIGVGGEGHTLGGLAAPQNFKATPTPCQDNSISVSLEWSYHDLNAQAFELNRNAMHIHTERAVSGQADYQYTDMFETPTCGQPHAYIYSLWAVGNHGQTSMTVLKSVTA
jgi:hypothetical protein